MVQFVVFFAGVCLLNVGHVLANTLPGQREALWPIDMKTPFSYPTYFPMDIDTNEARVVNTSKPLHVNLAATDNFLLCNNGYLVRAVLNQPATKGTITGGILGDDVYIIHEVRYYWNNDWRAGASNTIDCQSSPLQAIPIWYNQKYGSYNNSQNFRDGILMAPLNVDVQGYIPNPQFTTLEKALKSVIRANTEILCISGGANAFFFDVLPLSLYYYAYPGAAITIDQPTQQRFCATIIQFPKSFYFSISIPQFKAFQNLENIRQSPIDATLTSYPRGPRPLIQACGATQFVF